MYSTMAMRDDVVEGKGFWLVVVNWTGMQWDIVEIVCMIAPRSCVRHSSHSSQPRTWHKILRSPVWLSFFVLLCFFRLPRSREISSIKIDLEKKSLIMHLILMLMNPDVTRTLLCKEATSERWAIVITHHLAEAKEMGTAKMMPASSSLPGSLQGSRPELHLSMPLQLDGGTGKRLDSRVRRAQWPRVPNVQTSRPGPVSVPSDAKGGGSEPSIGRLIRYMGT